MKSTTTFSILHISDFHFSKKKWHDQEIVIESLAKDLERICIGHRRPDLVIFTGDLVNAAGHDDHSDAYDHFLSKILDVTRCSDERLIVVPGNHDARRSFVEKTLDEHVVLQKNADIQGHLNSDYLNSKFDNFVEEKFRDYNELENYLYSGQQTYKNSFVTVRYISALNLDVVVINTAVLSSTGEGGLLPDKLNLAIPEYAVRDALKHLSPGSFRLFSTHHPLSWLSDTSQRMLDQIFQGNCHAHFFGHMHEPLNANITSYKGELFSSQAGAAFSARDRYIGYSLISVEKDARFYETHLRTYFKDRNEFDAALDVVANGRFYSSQEARGYWEKVSDPVDPVRLAAYLSEQCYPEACLSFDGASLSDKSLRDLFVPPPMLRSALAVESEVNEPASETHVSFDELVCSEANILLCAAPEFGRTTVLREIQVRLMSDACSHSFPRLPVLIDFQDIKTNASAMLRCLRGAALAPEHKFDLEILLRLGHACVLIDDVTFGDASRMRILRDFVNQYPKPRYILSSLKSSAAPFGSYVDPELPVRFEMVELKPFRRRDMRKLVEKWAGTGRESGYLVDRLQSEIGEINLPFTAANGSILMVIYEANSGFRPINRSVLIEQFIDIMLRKGSSEQSQRDTFDYKNKTDLLAYIAGWMAQQDQYAIGIEEVRGIIKTYLDHFGINVKIDGLIKEFLLARIFTVKAEDRIAFRYRAFLEYFISLQMVNSKEFRDWLLDESRYLRFTQEISYYAGKVRNDLALLEEMGARFDILVDELEAEQKTAFDLRRFDKIITPSEEMKDSLVHLEEQLHDGPLSEEEKDKILDAELPRDVENRQDVFRPKLDDFGKRFVLGLLLYSGVIKNMETVPDPKKREHLNRVWRGWAIFLLTSLLLVPKIATQRKIRINGVLYEVAAPVGMSAQTIARLITLGMPLGMSKLISSFLGSEKLERQLVEPGLDTVEQPAIFEWFRAALISDLRLPAAPSALKRALELFMRRPYLTEALIFKIYELRRFGKLDDAQFSSITSDIAEAIVRLGGSNVKNRDQQKRREMVRLERQGLILRLKDSAEED